MGQRWSRYARETLCIPDHLRCKYPHVCQGGRIEQVWAYPIIYVTRFDQWLWAEYFPKELADYRRYRSRRLALPASSQKSLANQTSSNDQPPIAQQPLLFDELR